jgi:hypothetical protein
MTLLSNEFGHKYLLALIIIFLILPGCRITLLPSYDETITQEIIQLAKQIDGFYLEMLETTNNDDGGRAYNKFMKRYIELEVELTSILNKNKIRPLNENSTRICEITLELWIKYKEEHKEDDEITDGLIKLSRLTFSDLFYAMLVAEKAKDIISNPPNK